MNERIDPRIDKMVAFLYGELPEGERRAFERMLEKDDALRTEFEELKSVRGVLAGWEMEERVPSFVLVEGREEPQAGKPSSPGLLDRFTEWARSLAGSPAWALAATAVLLLVLAVGGFRIERVDGGVAFRFGGDRPAPAVSDQVPGLGTGQELALRQGPADAGGVITPVADLVTQEDLDTRNEELLMGLMNALNDYGQRRDQERYAMVQSMYQQLRDEQNRDYRQLNGRLDTMGLEVLATRNGVSLEDLLKTGADTGSGSGEE